MPKILLIAFICLNICVGCGLVRPIEIKKTEVQKPPLNLLVQPIELKNVEYSMQNGYYVLDETNFQNFSENQLKILYKLREYQLILNSYKNYYENPQKK